MYVTPANLADGPDALKELSELFGVDAAVLGVVIAAGDTSSYDPADVTAAQDALASVERYCALAQTEVDSRLQVRGYALPMDATQFPVLTVWSRSIVRYHLNRMRDRTTEEQGRVERDYRDAIKALDLVAAGKLSLGAGDPLFEADAANDALVQIESDGNVFSRKNGGLRSC
jgi:phage gp36-like protein